MPTWNDLNTSQPPDTEVVSQGASRIRAVVDAGKTTWDLEHYQTGEHKIPTVQPGTPLTGQLWIDLVNKFIRRYDGANHAIANAVKLYFDLEASTIVLTSADPGQGISIPGVVVPTNGQVYMIYVAQVQTIGTQLCEFNTRLDGAKTLVRQFGGFGTAGALFSCYVSMIAFTGGTALAAGTYTISVDGVALAGAPELQGQTMAIAVM